MTIKTREETPRIAVRPHDMPRFLRNSETPTKCRQTNLFLYLEETIIYIPAVKPVLTDVTFDHKPAHIIGLPADTV